MKNDLNPTDASILSTLLIETKDGVEKQQDVAHRLSQTPAAVTFDVREFGSITCLVFVPVCDFCVIEIHDITITRSDESIYHFTGFQSNSLDPTGNILRFATNSPRISLAVFNQTLRSVSFKLTYRSVGNDALQEICRFVLKTGLLESKSIEKTLADKLALFAERISQNEFDLQRLKGENQALKSKLNALYGLASKPLHKRIRPFAKSVLSEMGKGLSKLPFSCSSFHDSRAIIEKSKLFDALYYLNQYPDLIGEGIDPLTHYIRTGAFEGRDPHPLFDSAYYLTQADLRESPPIPLLHYIETGAVSEIDPHPLFDTAYYLGQIPGIMKAGITPLTHYLEIGERGNKNPCPLFDTAYYRDQNPDVANAGVSLLRHFVEKGAVEGRDPNPFFETDHYLTEYPDVLRENLNPLIHYIQSGAREGRKTGRFFDSLYYLEKNPEIAGSEMNPLAHHIKHGAGSGNNPSRAFEELSCKPTVSIITPVFDVDESILTRCIQSVLYQVYPKWELCLVDDGSTTPGIREALETYANQDDRIRIQLNDTNQGIVSASNQAASMAIGEFLCFLDHDDELTKDALYEFVGAINQHRADVFYSDEAVINRGGRFLSYICKPDWSPDLLFSFNYITHLMLVKKVLFDDLGGFSPGSDGAQDYDLALRLAEKTGKIVHIPKVLYRWRQIEASTSINPAAKAFADENGQKALQKALERRKIKGAVLKTDRMFYYRVKREVLNDASVSILIPFKDEPDHLKRCINSIMKRTEYPNFTIIGIDNQSRQEDTFTLMDRLAAQDERISFYHLDIAFNFSKIINYAVGLTNSDHIVLMNNDIEVLNDGWLESLLEHSQRPEVGAVGAKLYYPDGKIQHAGVVIGIRGFAGHAHRNFPKDSDGYYHRLKSIQNVSAVTGALMMVKKRHYEEVGGLNENNLSIALNDIDLCLKLKSKGYSNIFTPFCEAIHHESVSRGYEVSSENRERFSKEVDYFKRKWIEVIKSGDPFYNSQLTLQKEDYSLSEKSRWEFDRLNRFRPPA